MATGHRLNTAIVLAAVHGLSGLFRVVSKVKPSLCHPLPTLSPSLIGHLTSVDVKHQEKKKRLCVLVEVPLVLMRRGGKDLMISNVALLLVVFRVTVQQARQ